MLLVLQNVNILKSLFSEYRLIKIILKVKSIIPLLSSTILRKVRIIQNMIVKGLGDPYSKLLTPEQFKKYSVFDITGIGLNLGTLDDLVAKTVCVQMLRLLLLTFKYLFVIYRIYNPYNILSRCLKDLK